MSRPARVIAFLFILHGVLLAQGGAAADAVRAKLDATLTDFASTKVAAHDKLLAEFARAAEEATKAKDVRERIAKKESLQAELERLKTMALPPEDRKLRRASSIYLKTLAQARTAVYKAFGSAAEGYDKAGDSQRAREILKQEEDFIREHELMGWVAGSQWSDDNKSIWTVASFENDRLVMLKPSGKQPGNLEFTFTVHGRTLRAIALEYKTPVKVMVREVSGDGIIGIGELNAVFASEIKHPEFPKKGRDWHSFSFPIRLVPHIPIPQ